MAQEPGVLKVYTNADLEFAVRWLDADKNPYALSGGRAQIRAEGNPDGQPLVDITADVTDPTKAVFVAPASALANLPEGTAVYDVVLTRASDGRVKNAVRNKVIVSKGVTR